jgi:hypothetical protein
MAFSLPAGSSASRSPGAHDGPSSALSTSPSSWRASARLLCVFEQIVAASWRQVAPLHVNEDLGDVALGLPQDGGHARAAFLARRTLADFSARRAK